MSVNFILGLFAGLVVAGMVYVAAPSAPTSPTPPVSSRDVSDLIDRLKPLTQHPEFSWGGVTVRFSGGGVMIDLTLPNGNELSSKANTLEEAVASLMKPSEGVKAALEGWKSAPAAEPLH